MSDHLPIVVTFSFDIDTFSYTPPPIPSMVDWKKVNGEIRSNFIETMERGLNNCVVPNILHGSHLCNDISHISDIERYYNEILNCILVADQQLPQFTPTTRKCYRNEKLSE